MRIGVPREIKTDEYRVALTPAGTKELTSRGHEVVIESGAGEGSSLADEDYSSVGARIAVGPEEVFSESRLILKVKEPLEEEYRRLEPGHILFTYLHLAPNAQLTRGLVQSGAACVAYETVETDSGYLPLLAPMSEIAGRLAPQAGAYFLERMKGGKGKLMGGSTGVVSSRVVVIGAGIAGTNAAQIAAGMKANVVVLDVDVQKLLEIEHFLPTVEPLMSNQMTVEEQVADADMVIGAVLVPGAKAPRIVTEDMIRSMQDGSVVVDISIDQGGCVETARMTTHTDPTYLVHGVIQYCVGNMPGAVPITSTHALTNSTLPYILRMAGKGLEEAVRDDRALGRGVNVLRGEVTNEQVAKATDHTYVPLPEMFPYYTG